MSTTIDTDKGVAERSMGIGLRALNWLAGSDLLDRIRLRKGVERALFQGTKQGFRTATTNLDLRTGDHLRNEQERPMRDRVVV